MASIFDKDIVSQYIDDSGKCRMLTYSNGVSLLVSPLAPFDLQATKKLESVDAKAALQFIKAKGLSVTSKTVNDEGNVTGLWLIPKSTAGVYYCYIAIKPVNVQSLKDIPANPKLNPLKTDKLSDLEQYKRDKKIAEYLKQYALYTYSLDTEAFGPDSFTVDPNHRYDIDKLNKRLYHENNNIMFDSNELLIVGSEEIRDKLISYVKVSILNDLQGVLETSKAGVIDSYQSISDFRTSTNQILFTSRNGLLKWIDGKAMDKRRGKVFNTILDGTSEPYFYRNIAINDASLLLIQNIVGDKGDRALKRALYVCKQWDDGRVNVGGSNTEEIDPKTVSYNIYTEDGLTKTVKKGGKVYNVLNFSNDRYAAILSI